MLVLRDLVGIEPLGGLYRALAGERQARGLLRAEAREDGLPGFARATTSTRTRSGSRSTGARELARGFVGASAPATCATTRGRALPVVVRARADVPGEPSMTAVVPEQRAPNAGAGTRRSRPRGLVFVSAGAGTGKTTVLVERFAKAVCERGLDVDSLLVITYTERAAGELRARIRARLAERPRDLARELDGAWISTIHGFCLRLLRAYPFAAGLDPRFRVLDESQARVLRERGVRRARSPTSAGDEHQTGSACSRPTARAGCAAC